jgi:sugar phosphate isomerase/epimerase
MKYSFMTFSCPQLTLDEALALAKRIGYDGVEPRLVSNHKHGIEVDIDAAKRKEVKSKFEDSGIAAACVATSCRFADPANSEQMAEMASRAVDLAADIGSSCIRVFGGQIGGGLSREEAIDLVAKSLLSIADHAGDRGVAVCMETHDAWCDPKNVAAVMEKVNHPAIAVNWDIMHPVRTNNTSVEESFETLKPWIKHMHVHDGEKGTGKLAPIGEGFIDHKTGVKLLQSISYDGFLSGEWINWADPYEVHLPRELATLKSYE